MIQIVKRQLFKHLDFVNSLEWFGYTETLQNALNQTRKRSIDNLYPLELLSNPEKLDQLKRFYAMREIKQELKYGNKNSELKVHDFVRIIKDETYSVFAKGFRPNFSDKTYEIVKQLATVPTTYLLKGVVDEKRPFYAQELVKASSPSEESSHDQNLFIKSKRLGTDGRVTRSGQKSNRATEYLLDSHQEKGKARWISETEKTRLQRLGLLPT